jgi:hypothetical protein
MVAVGCRSARDPARPHLEEVRGRRVHDDPAVSGSGTIPALTRSFEVDRDESFEHARDAAWQVQHVAVTGTAMMRVPAAAPGLFMVRASFPAATPVDVVVTQDGAALGQGVRGPAGVDRGSSFVRVELARAGELIVTLNGPPGATVVADVVSAVIARRP